MKVLVGFYCSKVVAKVNVFKKVVKTPRSRSKGQSSWHAMKGLLTRITYVKYESPSPYRLKVMVKVKVFFRSTFISKVNVQRSKLLVSNERCCLKEYICEI